MRENKHHETNAEGNNARNTKQHQKDTTGHTHKQKISDINNVFLILTQHPPHAAQHQKYTKHDKRDNTRPPPSLRKYSKHQKQDDLPPNYTQNKIRANVSEARKEQPLSPTVSLLPNTPYFYRRPRVCGRVKLSFGSNHSDREYSPHL